MWHPDVCLSILVFVLFFFFLFSSSLKSTLFLRLRNSFLLMSSFLNTQVGDSLPESPPVPAAVSHDKTSAALAISSSGAIDKSSTGSNAAAVAPLDPTKVRKNFKDLAKHIQALVTQSAELTKENAKLKDDLSDLDGKMKAVWAATEKWHGRDWKLWLQSGLSGRLKRQSKFMLDWDAGTIQSFPPKTGTKDVPRFDAEEAEKIGAETQKQVAEKLARKEKSEKAKKHLDKLANGKGEKQQKQKKHKRESTPSSSEDEQESEKSDEEVAKRAAAKRQKSAVVVVDV